MHHFPFKQTHKHSQGMCVLLVFSRCETEPPAQQRNNKNTEESPRVMSLSVFEKGNLRGFGKSTSLESRIVCFCNLCKDLDVAAQFVLRWSGENYMIVNSITALHVLTYRVYI